MKKFLTIFLVGLAFLSIALPAVVLAAATTSADTAAPNAAQGINVKLQVPLPFVKLSADSAVDNLKDYIEGVYRLLIGLGALFAVVMIIIAGYQYLTSGGSSDKTGAAKKRIWNASIGLILALLSYVILNAINTRLVELRLPKIEPIKQLSENSSLFCDSDVNIVGPLADLGTGTLDYNVDLDKAECGVRYADSVSGLKCWGSVCTKPPGSSCLDNLCVDAYLFGDVKTPVSLNPLNMTYVTKIQVYKICGALATEVDAKSLADNQTAYRLPKPKFLRTAGSVPVDPTKPLFDEVRCLGGDYKGYALKVTVHDGILSQNNEFVVLRDCSKSVHGFKGLFSGDIFFSFSSVPPSSLIQQDELDKGYRCNIDLTDPSFADFD